MQNLGSLTNLYIAIYVTWSDKTSLNAKNIPIHIMVSISYSVCAIQIFIQLLRIYCIHGEVCAKKLCSEKLEGLKLIQFLMAIRLVLSDVIYIILLKCQHNCLTLCTF